jgi:hypothetical protein
VKIRSPISESLTDDALQRFGRATAGRAARVHQRQDDVSGAARFPTLPAMNVRFGSKAEKLDASIRCPLCPRKQTSSDTSGMSALCH